MRIFQNHEKDGQRFSEYSQLSNIIEKIWNHEHLHNFFKFRISSVFMVYINIRSRNKASPFFNRSLDLIRFKSEKDLSQSAEENERDVECLCAIFENVRNVVYVCATLKILKNVDYVCIVFKNHEKLWLCFQCFFIFWYQKFLWKKSLGLAQIPSKILSSRIVFCSNYSELGFWCCAVL